MNAKVSKCEKCEFFMDCRFNDPTRCGSEKKIKAKKQKELTDWDWTTLVAAWRYYEHRMTIASAMFPGEIVQRFFGGDYTDESCKRIARQFAYTDHHRGESDWTNSSVMDCDKKPWCKFFAFCKAYCDGFATIVLDGDDAFGNHLHDEQKCFWCDYTKRWYPVNEYIAHPEIERYCGENFIKEIKK